MTTGVEENFDDNGFIVVCGDCIAQAEVGLDR